MSLSPGTRLGSYEVLSLLGAGGMGEVYRAVDTNLKRQVAIKVLPQEMAGDAERLARFQREAEVLATLNHANIAHIHGLEKSAGTVALVMELVEGPTLADRMAKGAVPLDESLHIARQLAEALEAAHDQGIIHRDLKPANIKIRDDGTVKVLDFGLAKLVTPDAMAVSSSLSRSPTLTTPAGTLAGVILGTAAYMSPEQARGKQVDKRADIWAFGVILYELVTGERLFGGEDVGEILAAVIKDRPSLDRASAQVRPLLERCLEKDPRKRLRDIGDIDLLLRQPQQPAVSSRARTSLIWPVLAAVLLGTTTVLAILYLRRPLPIQQTLRFQLAAPGSAPAEMFALSPDGLMLAFVVTDSGPNRLWLRAFDTLDPHPLPATDGATFPFWAPDGQHLGFFADGKLKTIAVIGAPPQVISDAANGRGGSWGPDGTILFSPSSTSPIMRVPASGGTAAAVTRATGEGANGGHRYPSFFPDGRHFLYNAGSDKPEESGVFVGSLDGAPAVRLLPDVTNGIYVPATKGGGGYVLFRRAQTLMALPFDPANLRSTGEAIPIVEQVALGAATLNTFGAFSASATGALVYRTAATAKRQLTWVDRSGRRLSAATASLDLLGSHALSPDGNTVAMRIGDESRGGSDLWLQDLTRGTSTRFTFLPGFAREPVWSPDGRQVLFESQNVGGYSYDLQRKSVSGVVKEEPLLHSGTLLLPTDWSPDGQFVVYRHQTPTTGIDLWLLPMTGDRKPVLYLQTRFNEDNGRIFPVPSQRWMAYESNESGRDQIYVQTIPASGAKYQVSTAGGTNPRWRSDGRELFFVSAEQKLMAAPIMAGTNFQVGAPQELFSSPGMRGFTPSRDGQRFLLNLPAGGAAAPAQPLTIVTNWQSALDR